ncbi:glycosyltransferase family 4 protein [Maribacter halichondriae]|uniref:glycosyltransferase family 4 protein n=1 Tax=Maribacter halichondriae TaxID=2980554 RepID=UPI0030767B45
MHNEKEGFLIQGWASDAQKIISEAKVLLAPLRFGAGLKGKLVDAMLSGTPSITTSIGAEGIHGHLEWNGEICNDYKDFAQAAITCYKNQMEWHLAQQNGQKIINRFFDKTQLSENFRQKLRAIQESLAAHRGKNFIGSLLRHQALASTKYMAKWIEEKNKG